MEEVQSITTHPAQYLFNLMFTGIFIGHGTLLNVRLYARALYLKNKSAQDKHMSLDILYLQVVFFITLTYLTPTSNYFNGQRIQESRESTCKSESHFVLQIIIKKSLLKNERASREEVRCNVTDLLRRKIPMLSAVLNQ